METRDTKRPSFAGLALQDGGFENIQELTEAAKRRIQAKSGKLTAEQRANLRNPSNARIYGYSLMTVIERPLSLDELKAARFLTVGLQEQMIEAKEAELMKEAQEKAELEKAAAEKKAQAEKEAAARAKNEGGAK